MIRMAKYKSESPETESADMVGTVEDTPKKDAEESPQINSASPIRLIYVGPNIPGGILQRFQVFKGGLPPHAKGLIEQVPEVKDLFVPVTELEDARRKIEEPGTNEARLFYAVQ